MAEYRNSDSTHHKKKRKRTDDYTDQPAKSPKTNGHTEPNTSKPTAVFTPSQPRTHTLSIALPGSIIANAKTHDSKTFLCGQIARALAVFNVDEVIIFNDGPPSISTSTSNTTNRKPTDDESYTAITDPSHFLAHVLTYLETPPHLRRHLFPIHPNLRTAGTLPSLDMPHHLRASECCGYREGVVTESSSEGTYVEIGLTEECFLSGAEIPPNTRVTVELGANSTLGTAVSPTVPRESSGYYWGYTVRSSPTLSTVLTECPFDGGYDLSFGTSERGQHLSSILNTTIPEYKHMLIVFGGVAGLETAAKNDPELSDRGIKGSNVGDLFDYWINLVPGQGSRTIRTEEAVWVGLMGLRGVVMENGVR